MELLSLWSAAAWLGCAVRRKEQAQCLPRAGTFSRSGSSKPSANSLLSITEEAATSSGVDPLIDGEAEEGGKKEKKGPREHPLLS